MAPPPPPCTATRCARGRRRWYHSAATGWAILERHDLTAEFMANCIRKLNAKDDLRAELEPLTGAADFDARQARMRRRIAVLEQRHLRRELFIVEPAA